MPEPKLIFVNRVYWPNESATAQLLTDLAEGLANRGHEVHVVCGGGGGDAERHGVRLHRVGGDASHRGFRHQAGNYLAFTRGARAALRNLVDPGDIVVVKSDPPLLAVAATGPARARGARVVQWIQDIYPEILPLHYGAWLRGPIAPLRWWRNRAWLASETCVVVGDDMRATVERQGVAPERVQTMPNWAPAECSAVAGRESILAQRASWNAGDRLVVAYSGNHGRVHEFATLLGAARRLADDPGILFLFIGAGPRRSEVAAEAQRLALTNVRFLPATPRSALAASLGAADVHVVTLRPGFEAVVNPSKLTGILAAGRPAVWIGPPRSACATLLESERCGLVVDNGQVEALADAFRRLKSPELRSALGASARRVFEGRLDFASQLDRWDRMFRAMRLTTTG